MKRNRQIIDTFLGAGASFRGELEFSGAMRVDTRLEGKVRSKAGLLIVGEEALVDAEILVDRVVVYGTMKGRVRARKRVEIKKGGRVEAHVESPVVTMDRGAVLCGTCDMSGAGPAKPNPGDASQGSTAPPES